MQKRRHESRNCRQVTIEVPAWMGFGRYGGMTGVRCQSLVSLEADIHADPDSGLASDPLTGQARAWWMRRISVARRAQRGNASGASFP
jgi:hypothetical protein